MKGSEMAKGNSFCFHARLQSGPEPNKNNYGRRSQRDPRRYVDPGNDKDCSCSADERIQGKPGSQILWDNQSGNYVPDGCGYSCSQDHGSKRDASSHNNKVENVAEEKGTPDHC